MYIKIKVGSITAAQRGQDVLRKAGIKSTVSRLENPKKGDGCGYLIVTNSENAVKILTENKIRVIGVETS